MEKLSVRKWVKTSGKKALGGDFSWAMILIYCCFPLQAFTASAWWNSRTRARCPGDPGSVLPCTNREIDLTIVAALLTIVGFSINDTIVIYDRVEREPPKITGRSIAAGHQPEPQ